MRLRGALDRVRTAFAVALSLAILGNGPCLGADTFEEVQRAADAGEFARALSLVRAEADPRLAVRAEIWLWYRARDFDAAFASAERALTLEPGDLWLAERASAAALWLRDPDRAQATLVRFTANLKASAPAEAERFRAPWEEARTQTEFLLASTARAHAARIRAAVCSLAIGAAVLFALIWLGMGLHRARP